MTKLEALNEMMIRLGMGDIPALDTGGNSKAGHVERLLDNRKVAIERQGWYWNTWIDVTLSPDNDDHLLVPAGVYTIDTYGDDADKNLRSDGTKLYDVEENTDEFDDPVQVTYVKAVDFEDIPPAFAAWIICEAAKDYFRFMHRNDRDLHLRMRELDRMAFEARGLAMRDESDAQDVNLLKTSEVRRLKGNRLDTYPRITGE